MTKFEWRIKFERSNDERQAKVLVIARYSEGSRELTPLAIRDPWEYLGMTKKARFVIRTFELRHSLSIRISSFVIPFRRRDITVRFPRPPRPSSCRHLFWRSESC